MIPEIPLELRRRIMRLCESYERDDDYFEEVRALMSYCEGRALIPRWDYDREDWADDVTGIPQVPATWYARGCDEGSDGTASIRWRRTMHSDTGFADDAKDTLVLTVTMDERGANDAITPAMVVMRVPYELWRLMAEDAEDEPPMDVWYLKRRD